MAFIRLPDGALDVYTVVGRPHRNFISSSLGITGSVRIFPRSSPTERLKLSDEVLFEDASEDGYEQKLLDLKRVSSEVNDFFVEANEYMNAVSAVAVTPRNKKVAEIKRLNPGVGSWDEFSVGDETASLVTPDTSPRIFATTQKVLQTYYAESYPDILWGCSNYFSLHFPKDVGNQSSVLIYPSENNQYIPQSDFTIEFFVKPTYTNDPGDDFGAATILHASSSFAISLVSGSSVDENNQVDKFRILLQLSHSADISPSEIDLSLSNNQRPFPEDLVFLSDDNSIKRNHWTHIAIRWSPSHNSSTGSIRINNKDAGFFHIPSGSVTAGVLNPEAIFVGNYFESERTITNRPAGFFNTQASQIEGVTPAFGGGISYPTQFDLAHPFVGELHEIRIWNSFRDLESLTKGMSEGVKEDSSLLFYLPPLFSSVVPTRQILVTPYQSIFKQTTLPINEELSFYVNGHDISLENHVKELVQDVSPRLLYLTASVQVNPGSTPINSTTSVNDVLFANSEFVRRNMTIFPCDNGLFRPNYSWVQNTEDSIFTNALGSPSPASLNLSSVIDENVNVAIGTARSKPGILEEEASPENPQFPIPDAFRTVFQRTGESFSRLSTIFNVSNVFYGERINPASLRVIDTAFSGSANGLSITLKDNGRGSLYRADASSPHALWATVGSSLYEEGVVSVTAPYFGDLFGKDGFDISFRGENSIHVLETQVVVPAWEINSSSNPTFKELLSSDYANDQNPGFVYINQINLHDENLNVVAKAKLAQPIAKRPEDRMLFRLKFDF